MARARLADVYISGTVRERMRRIGTGYVYYPGTTANDSAVPMYTKATETTLAATYAISALTAAYNLIPHVAVVAA